MEEKPQKVDHTLAILLYLYMVHYLPHTLPTMRFTSHINKSCINYS